MNYPNPTPHSSSGSNENALLCVIALFGVLWIASLHLGKRTPITYRDKPLISANSSFEGDATHLWWRRLHPYLSQRFMNQVYPLVTHLDTLETYINHCFNTDRFSRKDLVHNINLYDIATREFSGLITRNSTADNDLSTICIYPYQDWSNPANYHTFWSYQSHCITTLADFRAQFVQCSHTP